MTWEPGDYVVGQLAEQAAPPQSLDALIKDGTWNWFFRRWAEDQDNTAHAGSNFLSELWNNMDWGYLEQMYVQDGAMYKFEALSPELAERVHNLAEGMAWDDSDEKLRNDAYQFTYGLVDGYTAAFLADVQAIQGASESVSPLQRSGLTRDRIDRAVVDNANEQALKDMERGDVIQFEQSGDIVFANAATFDSFAPGYRAWIQAEDDYCWGNLTMTAKGRGIDPGELTVSGAGDEAEFKKALRAVTKKKITFR